MFEPLVSKHIIYVKETSSTQGFCFPNISWMHYICWLMSYQHLHMKTTYVWFDLQRSIHICMLKLRLNTDKLLCFKPGFFEISLKHVINQVPHVYISGILTKQFFNRTTFPCSYSNHCIWCSRVTLQVLNISRRRSL